MLSTLNLGANGSCPPSRRRVYFRRQEDEAEPPAISAVTQVLDR